MVRYERVNQQGNDRKKRSTVFGMEEHIFEKNIRTQVL